MKVANGPQGLRLMAHHWRMGNSCGYKPCCIAWYMVLFFFNITYWYRSPIVQRIKNHLGWARNLQRGYMRMLPRDTQHVLCPVHLAVEHERD